MKTNKAKFIKPATDEKTVKTTKQELQDELRVKEEQLANNKARLEGGFIERLGRNVLSIDKEIASIERQIEMISIQISHDSPVMVKYKFEENARYRELKKEIALEEQETQKELLKKVKEQKEAITKEIPELELRIGVIKETLKGMPEEEKDAGKKEEKKVEEKVEGEKESEDSK